MIGISSQIFSQLLFNMNQFNIIALYVIQLTIYLFNLDKKKETKTVVIRLIQPFEFINNVFKGFCFKQNELNINFLTRRAI